MSSSTEPELLLASVSSEMLLWGLTSSALSVRTGTPRFLMIFASSSGMSSLGSTWGEGGSGEKCEGVREGGRGSGEGRGVSA